MGDGMVEGVQPASIEAAKLILNIVAKMRPGEGHNTEGLVMVLSAASMPCNANAPPGVAHSEHQHKRTC
eukprot:519461-Pelagomonas_calceolata.AAC.5